MALPSVKQAHVLDALVGLLVVTTLPLAVVVIPNTISVVADLLPAGVSTLAMIRAHGLALPAMLVTVPLAVSALRRFRPASLLVAGLLLLAVAEVAAAGAGSPAVVALLRIGHGVAAGLIVPATFTAVRERPEPARRWLVPLWATTLPLSLLGSQALALWALADASTWQVTLRPYPMLTGAGLVLAAAYTLVRRRAAGGLAEPSPSRRLTTLALIPSTGVAALAVATTFDLGTTVQVIVAAVAVLGLLGVAWFGGKVASFALVVVGLVLFPTAAPMTFLELEGLGGPGLPGLAVAGGIAAATALLVTWYAVRVHVPTGTLAGGGFVVLVGGLCAVRLLVPAESTLSLIVPMALLATGAAAATATALRHTGGDAALFALSLCFPAVLAGFLAGAIIQAIHVRTVRSGDAEALVTAFSGALHLWALIVGVVVVGVLAAGVWRTRRGAPRPLVSAPASSASAGG
ncbi:hypothetical protein [Rhizohabitans arisaemae]|uniref:hypothetical protein n=1 Tax=Rhizohabitans arisaemae TaxID=2720610 RepID=UPI0024B07E0C|nr:hypothetical protein [Rhizohabitans arisaemae]